MDVNFYEILGVAKTASSQDVKLAYRKLMRSTHPDMGGTNALFRLINEAYETLSDPEKRDRYDWEQKHGSTAGSQGFKPNPSSNPEAEYKPASEPTYKDAGEHRKAEREEKLRQERLKREQEEARVRKQEQVNREGKIKAEQDRILSLTEYHSERARKAKINEGRWRKAFWVVLILVPIIYFILFALSGLDYWFIGAIIGAVSGDISAAVLFFIVRAIFEALYKWNTKMGERL